MKKGQNAISIFVAYLQNISPSVNTMIHTFDHTIKPILHYSAEVWDTFETELKTEESIIRNHVLKN